jgi:hypothetical protein
MSTMAAAPATGLIGLTGAMAINTVLLGISTIVAKIDTDSNGVAYFTKPDLFTDLWMAVTGPSDVLRVQRINSDGTLSVGPALQYQLSGAPGANGASGHVTIRPSDIPARSSPNGPSIADVQLRNSPGTVTVTSGGQTTGIITEIVITPGGTITTNTPVWVKITDIKGKPEDVLYVLNSSENSVLRIRKNGTTETFPLKFAVGSPDRSALGTDGERLYLATSAIDTAGIYVLKAQSVGLIGQLPLPPELVGRVDPSTLTAGNGELFLLERKIDSDPDEEDAPLQGRIIHVLSAKTGELLRTITLPTAAAGSFGRPRFSTPRVTPCSWSTASLGVSSE